LFHCEGRSTFGGLPYYISLRTPQRPQRPKRRNGDTFNHKKAKQQFYMYELNNLNAKTICLRV